MLAENHLTRFCLILRLRVIIFFAVLCSKPCCLVL